MTTSGHHESRVPAVLLYRDGPRRCPYLPGRKSTDEFFPASRMDASLYEMLMNLGFRRSGRVIYRPVCDGCRECIPLRVSVNDFEPSRSQRRVLRRNRDVRVEIGPPEWTEEKHRIYAAYLAYQHDGTMSDGPDDMREFLYQSPTETLEMVYRDAAGIVGVGIVDACPNCLSSVYFYFAPEHARRSPGVFSTLSEISLCRERGVAYWYAGYYIRECRQMSYKSQFVPYELLGRNGWGRSASEDAGGAD